MTWVPITNFEKFYEVSDTGKVRSLDRIVCAKGKSEYTMKGRVLKPSLKDYAWVNLCVKSKNNYCTIHRLVAAAFIPNPENKPCVNHLNGNKHDNRVVNLSWCSHKENTQHAYDTKLITPANGETHYIAKLSNKQVIAIRKCLAAGKLSITEVAAICGINRSGISGIKSGKTHKRIKMKEYGKF
jgi:hypothetical protein